MSSRIKWRLVVLGAAAALMGMMIAFVTVTSQRQGADLRTKLDQADTESFNLAEHFKDSLRDLYDKLARYRTAPTEAAWQDYLKSNRELESWIQGQLAAANTPREKDILNQMDSLYAAYLAAVEKSRATVPVPAADGPDALSQTRRHLFDLGQDLSQAHLEVKKQLMTQAHASLTQLRMSVLVALGLLFLSGLALAALVYRDMIAPLRSQLVESQALVERNEKLAALGLVAAGLAHEIRNPLTAVKAALFTQQKKFLPGSPETSDIKVVEREILRLERIVNDFLNFARPSDPELKIVAADLLLLEAKLLFAPQLAKYQIQVKLEPGPPLRVRVDPEQMKQVLINLVQNAADSIGHDGTITLAAKFERKLLPDGKKNAVVLEVSDTGGGVPPEAQKRLFDPFFTTKDTGTGLGLSIAARIVQKHGGVLQHQSQVNHGAIFDIVLPQVTE